LSRRRAPQVEQTLIPADALFVEQADRDLRPRRGVASPIARARAASAALFVLSIIVRWLEVNAQGHCNFGPALNRENRHKPRCGVRPFQVGWGGRLSGRPLCLTAGTGWCAVSPSKRFLNAIGMDHVLTSITCCPSRRPTKFPLRSYKLALRTMAILAPSLSSRNTSPLRITATCLPVSGSII
jgi:hypothetical protein